MEYTKKTSGLGSCENRILIPVLVWDRHVILDNLISLDYCVKCEYCNIVCPTCLPPRVTARIDQNILGTLANYFGENQKKLLTKRKGGRPLLPVEHAIPKEQCSEHYSTRVHPAQEGKPHFPEIHCQATDLFWGMSAKMSGKKKN